VLKGLPSGNAWKCIDPILTACSCVGDVLPVVDYEGTEQGYSSKLAMLKNPFS